MIFDNDFLEEDVVVGNEVISRQSNDKIVKEIEKNFERMLEIVDGNPEAFHSADAFFKLDSTKDIIDNIDSLIYKRFGINTKHVSNPDSFGNYAVIPTLPIGWNTLNKSAGDLAKKLAQHINENMLNKYNTKNAKDINTLSEDEDSLVYNIYKSIKIIDKQMKTEGVVIDLNKVKIKNLPKDYNIFILVNFYNLIKLIGLDASELTSVLLHEIGHAFTHIEYMYASTRNMVVLVETLREEMKTKKDTTEVLRVVHKKLVGKYPDPDKTEIQIITDAYDNSVNPERILDKHNYHMSIDSEQQADQFSSRFGYGVNLIQALAKFKENGFKLKVESFKNGLTGVLILASVYAVIFFLITFSVIAFLLIPIMLGTAILVYILLFIYDLFLSPIFTFLGSLIRVIFRGTTETESTYDNIKRRMERIVNDLIRQIRLSSMDLKEKKKLVLDIETGIDIIDSIKVPSKPVMQKVVSVITPNKDKEIISRQHLGELIEDLKENRLHLAAAKLEAIGIESKEIWDEDKENSEWPPVEPKNFFDELTQKYKG